MGLSANEFKSPKAPPYPSRRQKTSLDEQPHVRVEKAAASPDIAGESRGLPLPPKTEAGGSEVLTPSTNFPSVGLAPGTAHNFAAPVAPPGEQWHTAADPSRSIIQLGPGANTYFQHPSGPQVFPQPVPSPFNTAAIGGGASFSHQPAPFIGLSPREPRAPNMSGDYSHTAPPPMGVNFQPPVPDTTHGPMNHTYFPRFDGDVPYYVHQPGLPLSQSGYVYPQYHPGMYAVPNQPAFINGQTYMAQGPPGAQNFQAMPGHVGMTGGVAPMAGGIPPFLAGKVPSFGPPPPPPPPSHHQTPPDISGFGRTPQEEQLRQVQFAYANKLFEPQEFKPADEDPSRYYFLRERDGNWIQCNRFTIDNLGSVRWYVTDEGWFYAVRLPD